MIGAEPTLIVEDDDITQLLENRAWLAILQAIELQSAQLVVALMDGSKSESAIREAQGRAAALGWVMNIPSQILANNFIAEQSKMKVNREANEALEAKLRKRLIGGE